MSPTLRVHATLTGIAAILVLDIASALWPSRWLVLPAVGIAAAILTGLAWSTAAVWWDEATEHRRAAAARVRIFDRITARRAGSTHTAPDIDPEPAPAADPVDEHADTYRGWFTPATEAPEPSPVSGGLATAGQNSP